LEEVWAFETDGEKTNKQAFPIGVAMKQNHVFEGQIEGE